MSVGHPFCAQLLTSSAPGIAAMVVERLFAADPDLAARYAPHAATKWRENIAARLAYLAAAVSAGRPEVFADQAAWDKVGHASRGGSQACSDLERSMRCLREVVADELPVHAGAPALECLDLALARLRSAPTEVPTRLSAGTAHGRLAADYLLALLEGDRHRAAMLILNSVRPSAGAPGMSVREIYSGVLAPVQAELGRMWHMNETTIGEEHFATATTHMVISMLYPHLPRAPRNGRTVVAASVEGNAHEIGVRMVADVLEMDGWRAVYLGSNVPADDLRAAARDFKADLVALSASLATHLPAVRAAIDKLREADADGRARTPILVGGGAFSSGGEDLARSLGADGFAADLDQTVREAARLAAL